MAEKQHSFCYENNVLTVRGVTKVIAIDEKEVELKLDKNTLLIKGSGLNVVKLDKDQCVVVLETQTLRGLTYRQGGLSFKGLFR